MGEWDVKGKDIIASLDNTTLTQPLNINKSKY